MGQMTNMISPDESLYNHANVKCVIASRALNMSSEYRRAPLSRVCSSGPRCIGPDPKSHFVGDFYFFVNTIAPASYPGVRVFCPSCYSTTISSCS
ncbi:hypothetical protein LIA77_08453 [Sarocladium implicatum]|nr:hypothetical protein LIA77_08453 [Sarocladium implicatum]